MHNKQLFSKSPTTQIDTPHIRQTNNFEQFTFDETNRPIDRSHVIKLVDSIDEKNMLRDFPILVDESMCILDGQHRVEAAKMLNIPIYYIVSQNVTIADIATTNHNTRKWTMRDMLHRYVVLGYESYVKLDQFNKRYSFIPLNTSARTLCFFGDQNDFKNEFYRGEYRFNDEEFATIVANRLLEFKEAGIEFYNHITLIRTVANLTANVEYDHNRMMQKLEYLSLKLRKPSDVHECISNINEIYNYKSQNKVWLEYLNPADKRFRADKKRNKKNN